MFRIVMLGSGGSIPSPTRNVSCLGIRSEGKVFLFDACEGVQRQMMKHKLSYFKTAAVLVSHLHPDHFLGIPGLVYTLQLSDYNGELQIIGPVGIKEIVENLLLGNVPPFIKVKEFGGEEVVYECDEFSISTFRVRHSRQSYGFVLQESDSLKFYEEKAKSLGIKGPMFREIEREGKIRVNGKEITLEDVTWKKAGKRIVYSGDAVYDENIVVNAKNADLLIMDATFIEKDRKDADEKMHATAKDAAEIAKKAGCKRLVLTHISNRYTDVKAHLEEAIGIFKNTTVAEDGLEINI
ncbi:MAG: ribonuclease Z [Candidatus Micrarchaeia archaeon]